MAKALPGSTVAERRIKQDAGMFADISARAQTFKKSPNEIGSSGLR